VQFFSYIHYGWIIGLLVIGFFANLVFAIITHKKSRGAENEYFLEQRFSVQFIGLAVFSILMLCGLCCTPLMTMHLSSERDFNVIKNLPMAERCTYVLDNLFL
jgi:hypothetical protein